jgi:hypothetical protein
MEQIELSKNQLHIMQIIEKYSGIHHRELLNIVAAKKFMAKPTAEKNIKELLEKRKILVHKYKNQHQYLLLSLESSQKVLDKQIVLLITKLEEELSSLRNDIRKYEYYTKVSLADYLNSKLDSFLKLRPELERETERNKTTSMVEDREILDEIYNIVEKYHIDFRDPRYNHLDSAGRICTRISQLEHMYLEKDRARRKKGVSKKRSELNKELTHISNDLSKSHQELQDHLDQLKSEVK